jgi:acetyl-CoA carboxylase carboxyl transferase subunit alpha
MTYENVKKNILTNIKALKNFTGEELQNHRQDKFIAMGKFTG